MTRRIVPLTVLAAVVLVVAWYTVGWSPRSKAIGKAADRADAAEQHNDQLLARITALRAAEKDAPVLRVRAGELAEAVPGDGRLAEFILQANDAAAKAGVEFVGISPVRPAPAVAGVAVPGTPPEVKMTLQLTGGYGEILNFIDRLSALPRLVVLDGVNLTGDPTGRLTASLTGRMFVQPTALPAQTTTGVVQ